jgi:hypothetical protein
VGKKLWVNKQYGLLTIVKYSATNLEGAGAGISQSG